MKGENQPQDTGLWRTGDMLPSPQHRIEALIVYVYRAQELCESRGGRLGLIVLMVAEDVKQH